MKKKIIILTLFCLWIGLAAPSKFAFAEGTYEPSDLISLELEELLELKVLTATRRPDSIYESPAAVYVLTQEDIRRSGMTLLPECLRMVPGMQVARMSSSDWAISSRGFQRQYSNKLLVLIDGRSIYTPLFSGVFWDTYETIMEDIDRIEVVRGPGGALWGANAVNGIVSIVTKSAEETQGFLVSMGGGMMEKGLGGIRYGGTLRQGLYYRLFFKYAERDELINASEEGCRDEWIARRGGYRIDWDISGIDSLSLKGDIYEGDLGIPFKLATTAPPYYVISEGAAFDGKTMQVSWKRSFSESSTMTLQAHYDDDDRIFPLGDQDLDTYDIDFQHSTEIGHRHELMWGLGYRASLFEFRPENVLEFYNNKDEYILYSCFLQDRIALKLDRLYLTLGSKFEHNNSTGFESQPSIRLLWHCRKNQACWAALSRAVRTPARIERDIQVLAGVAPIPPPAPSGTHAYYYFLGDTEVDSEDLTAYELGYRAKIGDRCSFDIALFYHDYDNLIIGTPGRIDFEEDESAGHLVVPLIFKNEDEGESYGAELAINWRVSDKWRITPGYTYLYSKQGVYQSENFIKEPPHRVYIRSWLNLARNFECDTSLYYVDNTSATDLWDPITNTLVEGDDIPSYIRLDIRLGWRPYKNLEISMIGQNLTEEHHLENPPTFLGEQKGEIPRSFYGSMTWRF
ncbi:MAG: TonB-dependent receptor plug domain-containing protein [bacterium]